MIETKTYIVAKRNGLYKDSGSNYPTYYRVGANSKKDAIRLCRQKLDSTAGYQVKTIDKSITTPYGLVCQYNHSTRPAAYERTLNYYKKGHPTNVNSDSLVVEHNGRLWINTHEEKYVPNEALPNTSHLVERHVAIGSKSNNPIECWL